MPGASRPSSYDVTVEADRVHNARASGEGAGDDWVRYTVPLKGAIDDRWRRCFGEVQRDTNGFYRYKLEEGRNAVSFVCRQTQRPEEVQAIIARLGSFVELVNQTASGREDAE